MIARPLAHPIARPIAHGLMGLESYPAALALSPTAPGDLKQVQTWKKVASAKEIGEY